MGGSLRDARAPLVPPITLNFFVQFKRVALRGGPFLFAQPQIRTGLRGAICYCRLKPQFSIDNHNLAGLWSNHIKTEKAQAQVQAPAARSSSSPSCSSSPNQ